MSSPSIFIEPDASGKKPAIASTNVDLPLACHDDGNQAHSCRFCLVSRAMLPFSITDEIGRE